MFLDENGSKYPDDIIPITEPTALTFTASKACSDAAIYPFTMRIAPPAGDVSVIGNEGSSVSVVGSYKSINNSIPLNMILTGGGTSYTIDSGKPIIRNDPHRIMNPMVLVAGLLVLIALAYLLWKRTRMREHDRPGES